MHNVITTADELYDKVFNDYMDNSVELSTEYFDVTVKMPKKDILLTYKHLEEDINGDYVCRVEQDNQLGKQEYDEDKDFIPTGEYEDIYEGNCKDFLDAFKDKRFRRYTDEDDDSEVDFIY